MKCSFLELVEKIKELYAREKGFGVRDVTVRPAIPEDFEDEKRKDRWWIITGTRKGNVRIRYGKQMRQLGVGYGDTDFIKPIVVKDIDNTSVLVKAHGVFEEIEKETYPEYLKLYVVELRGITITEF